MPRNELLSLEEVCIIAERFMHHGVRKIRLTGGEPLVRRDVMQLVQRLGRHVFDERLDELTLTTNGSLLQKYATQLADFGVRRINVSIDTLDPEKFTRITRGGTLDQVLAGISAASSAGLRVKINMVALRGQNENDLLPVARWCADNGHDLSIIETMPLGTTADDHISLDDYLQPLRDHYAIAPVADRSAGPARYFNVAPLGLRLGLITPLSANFCDGCNRLRLTTDGKIYMCLGHDAHVDLRSAIRGEGLSGVDRLLQHALRLKPERHDFNAQLSGSQQRLQRHMNVTGG